ncbi:DNA/RNA helicase domain-containing protein [Nocardia sp. NBC_01327]|uniref:DNA/RNA helicase domain-containing protein n=1 Tax=Nocardia sp. NBC_01327 TaxID=2903593 RepID=UPI002E0DAB56|nr:DUF2075 domain-containing protein [Nocardia sp. NBC_01327]
MAPIDVVLAGVHPTRNTFSYAVIELKQWSKVGRPQGKKEGDIAYVYFDAYQKNKKHPAVQVYDNMIAMQTRHSLFDDRYVNLVGAAYLHNLREQQYQWICNVRPRGNVQTFTERTPGKLQAFLAQNFDKVSGADAAEALLERRRRTPSLQSVLGEVIRGHSRFTLVEHQLAAYDRILARLKDIQGGDRPPKQVFVISGRAGTGKSLIATLLLGEAIGSGLDARYVSGGVASRETFKEAAPRGTKNRFTTLSKLIEADDDAFELIVCDEAHRLYERPRRGSFGMHDGDSSVAVIVNKARVPVFFVDGDQRLFKEEVWTPVEIEEAAMEMGAEVVRFNLDRVVRSLGSTTYDTWVARLLAGNPVRWEPKDGNEPFELYYSDIPDRMERFLSSKQTPEVTARMTAGLCWPWEDRTGTVPEVKPTKRWGRPWNGPDKSVAPGVPDRLFWATQAGGFDQIGCVHTAQGLEYHWGGVIMGPDLTWDGSQWVLERQHVLSPAAKIRSDDDLHRALRNAYGVLLTRSMRGTVLYSTDSRTRELFADLGLPKCPNA